jgi:hypothetical protein
MKGGIMNSHTPNGWRILTILAVCFAITACTSKSGVRPQQVASLPRVTKILIAPPVIEYKDVKNNSIMEVPQEDQDRLCRALTAAIFDELASKGINSSGVVGSSATCQPSPNSFELYRIAKTQKGARKEHDEQTLSVFLKEVGEVPVLFLRSRFYVGPGFSYAPVSGFRMESYRMVLDAYLFSPVESEPVWQHAAQLRVAPQDAEDFYKNIVKTLLKPIQ